MSDFHPLVSIVIPVHNGTAFLREAIDSALAQTYDNCEVIVVNDGSCDNEETGRIALSYGDNIRYVAKEHGGVAAALNKGIAEMRGEYFSWLSQGDVFLPQKIVSQIAFMDKLELYDAVLYSDYAQIDDSGRPVGDKRLPNPLPDSFFQYICLNPEIHSGTLLIPKMAFVEAGVFSERLNATYDYDLWMRMCRRRSFVHQAEILVQKRSCEMRDTGMKPEHGPESRAFFERYLPELLEVVSAEKTPDEAKRQRLSLVPQLFAQGHGDIVKRFYTGAPRSDEREAALALLAELSRNQSVQQVKSSIKQVLRPIWLQLPEPLRKRVRGMKSGLSEGEREGTEASVWHLDFTRLYRENGFGATESFSGGGSSLFQTRILRRELPGLFQRLGVRSILDIPCGDFHWMRYVDFGDTRYIGGDVVAELAQRNQTLYGNSQRTFMHLDAVKGPLPTVDLIFCRDCLVHLPFGSALSALRTFKASGATWLLTTTFIDREENLDLIGLSWRTLNLCKPPFSLVEPVDLLNEKCAEGGGQYADKCLGLWKLADVMV